METGSNGAASVACPSLEVLQPASVSAASKITVNVLMKLNRLMLLSLINK